MNDNKPDTVKKYILLIEDNEPIRENTAELLELADFEVQTTNNGKDGLEAISKRIPDLILCDIAMPQMDGYEFLKASREAFGLTSTPFIFLTAYSEKNDIDAGMQLGATAYMVKPFDADELINLIRKHLA